MRQNMQYMAERGVLAMTPGQALDDVIGNLNIDRTRITGLKCNVELPSRLDAFGEDIQLLDCINSHGSVADVWRARHP